MKTVKTNVALFAGIIGWITFLLLDGILYLLLSQFVNWQSAAVVSGILGAMISRTITYIFARNKGVGFCVLFIIITAVTQYMMGFGYVTLSCGVASVFIAIFWLIGLTNKRKAAPEGKKGKTKK